MKPQRRRTRWITMILVIIVTILAVRAVAGDAIQGFLDGMVAGFTDGE